MIPWIPSGPVDGRPMFGTDRTAPAYRFEHPRPPRSLMTKLRDAWAGAVNGWKGYL